MMLARLNFRLVVISILGVAICANTEAFQPPSAGVCGKLGGTWNCTYWESNGDCESGANCNIEGDCLSLLSYLTIPDLNVYHNADVSDDIPPGELKKLKATLIVCGSGYYCLPYCAEVEGHLRCITFASFPVGGLDVKLDGDCYDE